MRVAHLLVARSFEGKLDAGEIPNGGYKFVISKFKGNPIVDKLVMWTPGPKPASPLSTQKNMNAKDID